MKTLKEKLKDWTDTDVAAFHLAVCMGLMPDDPKLFSGNAKHVFWSNDNVGNALYTLLFSLRDLGILEENDDGFRWNPEFKGSWE